MTKGTPVLIWDSEVTSRKVRRSECCSQMILTPRGASQLTDPEGSIFPTSGQPGRAPPVLPEMWGKGCQTWSRCIPPHYSLLSKKCILIVPAGKVYRKNSPDMC